LSGCGLLVEGLGCGKGKLRLGSFGLLFGSDDRPTQALFLRKKKRGQRQKDNAGNN
jgi:hypothetical protein